MNPTDVINSEAFLGLPIWAQIFFGLIIAIFLMFSFLFTFKDFRMLMLNMAKKIFHIAKQEKLLMHNLFFNKSYYYDMIYSMSFFNIKKTELFVILTKNKVDVSISMIKEFVKLHNGKFDTYAPIQLRELLFELRNRITKKSAQASREKYILLYGREKGLNLWGLIYESEKGYKSYWEDKNMFLNKNIDRLVASKSRGNEESMRSILTQFDIAIDLSILDCEETFNGLNGQIAELINE